MDALLDYLYLNVVVPIQAQLTEEKQKADIPEKSNLTQA